MTAYIELRVSKDGGYTWSDWKGRDLGATGDFIRPLIWRRLGNSRHFTFDFRATGAPDILAGEILDTNGDWIDAPVVGGAYADDNRPWTFQDTCNYIPVAAEKQGARSMAKLRGAPGERLFANVGNGPIRGARDVEGKLFVVSGTGLYRVFPDTSSSLLGTIPGTGRCTLTHNQEGGGSKLVVSNGTIRGWTYDTITETFAQIDDEAFPGFLTVDYLDQYILGIEPQRRYAFHSDLADAREYSSIDRFESESSPDRLLAQAVNAGQWWLFGERTIDVYANTGAATGTFQRIPGSTIDRGISGTHALAKLDNTLFFWGDDGTFYRLNGYSPVRVSTHPIEQAARLCDLSGVFCTVYEDAGHKIIWSTFPDGRTWGYDVASGEWFRRQSFNRQNWRMSTLVKWRGVWLAGDSENGRLYQVDWALRDEDGLALIGRRTTGALHNNENRLTVNAVRVLVDSGRAATLPTGPGDIIDPLVIFNRLPQTYVGFAVSHSYRATGGVRPYVFSIVAGALPAGLSMDADGLVTGTPTTVADYAWRVRVVDAQGFSATLDEGIDAGAGIDGGTNYGVGNPPPTLLTELDSYDGEPDTLAVAGADIWGLDSPVAQTIVPSPDGLYVAYGLATPPYLRIHKFDVSANEYVPLADPASLPPSLIGRIAWHPTGNYFVAGYSTGMALYSRSGDVFSLEQTVASGNNVAIDFSPDGNKFAACFNDATTTTALYPFIGGAIQTPSTAQCVRIQFGATSMQFSHDSLWLLLGGAQGMDVFDAGGADIAHFGEISTQLASVTVTWSGNDGYIYALGGPDGSSNRLAVFTFNGAAISAATAIQFDNFPASQPTASLDADLRYDGTYFAVAEGDTQLKLYEANVTGDQLTLTANQPPALSNNVSDVAWTNFTGS